MKSHEKHFQLDAVLKAYGFQRVPVAKVGNGLFASARFALIQQRDSDGCSVELQTNFSSIGLCSFKSFTELIEIT